MPLLSDGGLRLSQKQTEAWNYLQDDTHTEVFLGGGAGSGKSALGCLWQIRRRVAMPGTRGIIGRENFPALRDSTMNTFFEICGELTYRMGDHYHFNAQEHTVRWRGHHEWNDGSETHFRHLQFYPTDPDFNRFGSTEYTDGFLDEAPEIKKRAAQVLFSRMRYKHAEYNLIPKLLYTGNPGRHWIRDEFVMDEEHRPVLLPPHRVSVLATIKDHQDKNFRDRYEATLGKLDYYDRMRLLEGDWTAHPEVKRPFAFCFEKGKHVKECTMLPGRVVHIGVDFNVEPFCALLAHIWHDGTGFHFHILEEVSVKEATINEMAARIRAIIGPTSLIEMTGDRGGASRRIGVNSNASMYDDLSRALKLSSRQLSLPPNPTHLKSREDCNYALTHHPDLRIHPKCRILIEDMIMVEVDEDGSIIKGDREIASQRADMLDDFRYLTNSYLWEWSNRHRNDLSRKSGLLRSSVLPQPVRDVEHRRA